MAEVNFDIAMESTSQEILAKIEETAEKNGYFLPMYTSFTSSNDATNVTDSTLLKVEGKGMFYGAANEAYVDAGALSGSTELAIGDYYEVKVLIDGEVIYRVKKELGALNYVLHNNFSIMAEPMAVRNGTKVFLFGSDINVSGMNTNADTPYSQIGGLLDSEEAITSSDSSVKFCLLKSPIPFSESVEIVHTSYSSVATKYRRNGETCLLCSLDME